MGGDISLSVVLIEERATGGKTNDLRWVEPEGTWGRKTFFTSN